MHCHIEVHQIQGMTLIVGEAASEIMPPPNGLPNVFFFFTNVEILLLSQGILILCITCHELYSYVSVYSSPCMIIIF